MTTVSARAALFVLGALLLLVGCSGADGGDDDGASLGERQAPTEVTAPDVPAASPAGTGVIVVGGASSSFAVKGCQLEPGADPGSLLLVTGQGTTGRGDPFQIEVQRFSTDSAVASTFTDTITYTDTARILQVQRIEVAGQITDLRDPDARSTLLRVRPAGVAASGLAGPPGTANREEDNEGIVGLAVDASC